MMGRQSIFYQRLLQVQLFLNGGGTAPREAFRGRQGALAEIFTKGGHWASFGGVYFEQLPKNVLCNIKSCLAATRCANQVFFLPIPILITHEGRSPIPIT
uniref:Uncharacterized protein n=1 Tax=Poecilia latipinna TaxID=48699 RepID=A0A3B3V8A0_9TELE